MIVRNTHSIYAICDPRYVEGYLYCEDVEGNKPNLFLFEEPFYIGQSYDAVKRFKQHMWEADNFYGNNLIKEERIREIISYGLEPIFIVIRDGLTLKQANEFEEHYIKLVGKNSEGGTLVNFLIGGEGVPYKTKYTREHIIEKAKEVWKEQYIFDDIVLKGKNSLDMFIDNIFCPIHNTHFKVHVNKIVYNKNSNFLSNCKFCKKENMISKQADDKRSISCRNFWNVENKKERSIKYSGMGNPNYGKIHNSESISKNRISNAKYKFVLIKDNEESIFFSLREIEKKFNLNRSTLMRQFKENGFCEIKGFVIKRELLKD